MPAAADPAETERHAVDQAALRLMLAYVEAECLRLGATDAARHAALAAALMPGPEGPAPRVPKPRAPRIGPARARGVRLH